MQSDGKICIALKRLEFLEVPYKIAVTNGSGIYHDKPGILENFDGNTIVFYGSSNSSVNGYQNNYEKVRIIKSWLTSDSESIEDECAEFNALWTDSNPHVTVYDYTVSAQKKIWLLLKGNERRLSNLNLILSN